jgi:hypothetical protein
LLIEDPAEVRSRRQPHRLPGSDQTGLMAERAGEHQIIDGSISNDQIVGSVDRMINRMLSYTQVDHKATKQWLDKIQDRNFVELLLKSSLCRGYKPPQISLLAARSGSLSGKSVGSVATIKK